MGKPKGKNSKSHELTQENILLKAKHLLKGGIIDSNSDLDLEIENQFLKNIIEFEDAPIKPVYQIIGIDPQHLPPLEKLNASELEAEFNKLIKILAEHNFQYELAKKLPIAIAYRYITEELIFEEQTVLPDGWTIHIDGCDGDCPSCFQVDYCISVKELWTEEDLQKEQQQRKVNKK